MTENDTAAHWVRTWGAAPQSPGSAVAAAGPFEDATLRQVVRLSGGGRRLRVRFTNEYGVTPLAIGAARVGIAAAGGAVRPGSDRVLAFGGRPDVEVAVGTAVLSDPVDLDLPDLTSLCVSVYLPGRVESCTIHGRPMDTGWMIAGDAVAASALPSGATALPVRALISAVDVVAGPAATVVVALGDSLTDGFGSATDTDAGWPSLLAERIAGRGESPGYVVNQGVSGNRLLQDGIGMAGLARFDRDVLDTPGLGYVVVFEGINDLAVSFAPPGNGEFLTGFPGEPVTADDVIAGYRRLVDRAHERGVKIFLATLTPYEGLELFSPEGERARRAVNAWIRTAGSCDGVLDFDAVWRDPEHPSRVRDDLHAGDHAHGNDAGYRALADSIDLNLFR
ncbi:SGNH/GDSL hydrolase family protein [Actinoplanes philippinensis]|uniref:SGNH/GDSL hydrolase family protein n=1 Tax=Actinoplanes philippinensis TaxID=35752 RepID=UPI0033E84ED4